MERLPARCRWGEQFQILILEEDAKRLAEVMKKYDLGFSLEIENDNDIQIINHRCAPEIEPCDVDCGRA